MLRLQNLTKPMEKLMIKNVTIKFGSLRVALVASVGYTLIFASNALVQNQPPPPPPAGADTAPAAAAGAANSGAGFVDLTTVPVPAIQSVEILKDGASTTYGADAVAGVVNLKLYKDYRGAQVTGQFGNTLDKDAAEWFGDILFGVGDDKTSVTGDMFFYHHDSMFAKDRANTSVPPFLSSNTSPYNLQLTNAAVAAAGGTVFPTANGLQFATPPDLTNGLAPASDYIYNSSRIR